MEPIMNERIVHASDADLLKSDPIVPARDGHAIEWMIARAGDPGREAQRKELVAAMLARLSKSDDLNERVFLLRQLATIGREESVPVLTSLISDRDPILREYALRALERNPTADALEAIIAALGGADSPEWRVALINGLGNRRDGSAVSALSRWMTDPDESVAIAAILAAGNTGSPRAAELLGGEMLAAVVGWAKAARRAVVERACLLCADHLVRSGAKNAARPLFEAVHMSTASPLYRESSQRGIERCDS